MGTSVKGLLKGLRYISQIFDEKEPEMQIGLPTDVKHVAHIGWDGPAATNQNTPSWMNEFNSTPQTQTSSDLIDSVGELDLSSATSHTQESRDVDVKKAHRAPKSKRQTASESSSPLDSSSARQKSEKTSRRNRSSCQSADSASQEGSSRSSRRRRSNPGAESCPEVPVAKHSHRRRSKGSSDGGDSTRSRDNNSLTDINLPVLEAVDEEKGGEELQTRN